MYILSLKANKKEFNEIIFNRTGLSIITGAKKDKGDSTKTFNGVGKSLMIRLIDFCLGSNNIESFKTKLEGWEFFLEVEIKGIKYSFSRKTEEQDYIYINRDEKLKLKDFSLKINQLIFLNTLNKPYLTPRGILKRFLRPTKHSYVTYDKVDKKESDYTSLLLDAYLLGLDLQLIETKYQLIEELKKSNQTIKIIKNSAYIKKYMEGKKIDIVNLKIKDIEEKLEELEEKVSKFKIAENYSEVEMALNKYNKEHHNLENRLFSLKQRMTSIVESLEISTKIEKHNVVKLYEIAKIQISEMIKKRLEEVEKFHKNLSLNREKRYLQEKEKVKIEIDETKNRILEVQQKINKNIEFLSSYGALKEYDTLLNEIREKEQELAKLNECKEVIDSEKVKIDLLEKDLLIEKDLTKKYLEENIDKIEKLNNCFRTYSRKLYPDKVSGLIIQNDEGNATTRFFIKAEIDGDTSDGINSAKIFCYDMVKLFNSKEYIKFLIHDSRLFSDIDPRQIVDIFKGIKEFTEKNETQYIFTINENMLDNIKDIDSDFYEELKKCVVKNLYDTSEAQKLLGIKVNLNYE